MARWRGVRSRCSRLRRRGHALLRRDGIVLLGRRLVVLVWRCRVARGWGMDLGCSRRRETRCAGRRRVEPRLVCGGRGRRWWVALLLACLCPCDLSVHRRLHAKGGHWNRIEDGIVSESQVALSEVVGDEATLMSRCSPKRRAKVKKEKKTLRTSGPGASTRRRGIVLARHDVLFALTNSCGPQ